MCVPLQEKVHFHFNKDAFFDQQVQVGEQELVLVLSPAVVELEVEDGRQVRIPGLQQGRQCSMKDVYGDVGACQYANMSKSVRSGDQ